MWTVTHDKEKHEIVHLNGLHLTKAQIKLRVVARSENRTDRIDLVKTGLENFIKEKCADLHIKP